MVDDFGAGIGAETLFPGGDEGGVGDDLAGRINGADVFENCIGDGIFGSIGHRLINA